jgi:L-rhamnose mutarotase
MIRKAFVMSIDPGAEAEYERRHNPIWPELSRLLEAHGVTDYSIFLLPGTGRLFAYAVVASEVQWAAIAATPECRRWWQHMADIMPTDSGGKPTTSDLREVFHLT